MKMKAFSLVLSAVLMAGAMTACGGTTESTGDSKAESKAPAQSVSDASGTEESSFSYAEAVLGETATDITADLKFITHRTDLIEENPDGLDFQDYIKEFTAMYPNVTITYEGITDYEGDMTTRLTSGDWGDICGIPTTVEKSELGTYFAPIEDLAALSDKYEFIDNKAYSDVVYGIPSTGNVQGIVYNKRIWEEAGVTEIPKTPDAFIDALTKIKENTEAIPLYTNYAAGWTLTAWDAYIGGCATGDAGYKNQKLAKESNPFSNRGNGTGPYAVYDVLYRSVLNDLTEEDPTTTDWESCKPKINNGEIATMVLGSWAVPQMQEAGENAADIGYMPFPISVDGKQYASAGADYCYGININSTEEEKTAAMLYIKFLTEKSNFAYDQGGIPIVKGEKYPDVLEAFDGIELLVDLPSLPGEEDLYSDVNNGSELSFDSDQTKVARIVEAAETGSETLDDIVADWNDAWTQAQERYLPAAE